MLSFLKKKLSENSIYLKKIVTMNAVINKTTPKPIFYEK